MSRPRLLIPVTMQFSVRYLLRTGLLAAIGEYAQPVVVLGWDDEELKADFERRGAEVHRLTKVERGGRYEKVRGLVDLWHRARLQSPSTAIDERRRQAQASPAERLRRQMHLKLSAWQLRAASAGKQLLDREEMLLLTDTNLRQFAAQCSQLRVEAAFSVTPYLPDEEMMLRACAAQRMPLCTAILSFDNLTTRGWIPIDFDRYLLWNRYNRDELLRGYPQVSSDQVLIVGPAQFDFYWNEDYLWDEDEWRRRLRLPEGRPVILYGGGPHHIVPHEPHFVAQIDEAIEAGEIEGDPIILFRRHPNDPLQRWLPLLNTARHIIYEDPWPAEGPVMGRTNIRDEDIKRLASTLAYSHVHLNVSSTMAVDGAIFDRPQIGPAYDDRPRGRFDRICDELYRREHYLPIIESGGLDLVKTRAEMIRALNRALLNPARQADGRRKMVREICTYDDGQCTKRVSHGVRMFLGATGAERGAPRGEDVEAVV